MLKKISEHKYKLLIVVLLAVASVISVALAIVRMFRSDPLQYRFLVWNLLLAWIPMGFAIAAYASAVTRKPIMYIMILGCAVVWLVFFPNAPYILTDFQHLARTNTAVPVWYDVIMLIWFAWTGLLLGVFSLYLMQDIVARTIGKIASWLFVFLVTAMTSFGIYIGRFLRWNSWDTWQNPLPMAADVWTQIRHPFAHISTFEFTLIFAVLFLFIYITFYIFGNMANERSKQKSN